MRRSRRRRSIETLMNLTPLVDVMFLLMIFILVTAQYKSIYSMKVVLPKAESVSEVQQPEVAYISINSEGDVFFNEDQKSLVELEPILAALAAEVDPVPVVIQADEKSQTGLLVEVMDLVLKVGLKKISLQSDKKNP